MFSGQGSQYYHMGRELFETDAVFRGWMERLDATVSRVAGRSVLATLYSPDNVKSSPFERTAFTHPAIFMVEYALAQTLLARGVRPDIVLGASLGSFAAAAVAGLVDAEQALIAALRQAAVFEECCAPGGMIAVLHDPQLFEQDFLRDNCELAAVNLPNHFVIAAPRDRFAQIESGLRGRAVTYQVLPVSFAFHSRWIDTAREPFAQAMRSLVARPGVLPLMCSTRAECLTSLPEDFFWGVARSPIRFREAIAELERGGPCRYIDVGPAGTLATFLKYGLPAGSPSRVHAILSPYGRDVQNLQSVCAA